VRRAVGVDRELAERGRRPAVSDHRTRSSRTILDGFDVQVTASVAKLALSPPGVAIEAELKDPADRFSDPAAMAISLELAATKLSRCGSRVSISRSIEASKPR